MKKRVWIPLAAVAGLIAIGASGEDTVPAPEPATAAAPAPAAAPPQEQPAAAAPAPAKPKAPEKPKPAYAGALEGDKIASGGTAKMSGWTVSATALSPGEPLLDDKTVCTSVSLTNRDDKEQDFNMSGWKLQTPGGAVEDATFYGADDILDPMGAVAPGGSTKGSVCFEHREDASGQYILSWQPGFWSQDRVVWLNKL